MKITLDIQVIPEDGWRIVQIGDFEYISPDTDEEIEKDEYSAELWEKGYVAEELVRIIREYWFHGNNHYQIGKIRLRINGGRVEV